MQLISDGIKSLYYCHLVCKKSTFRRKNVQNPRMPHYSGLQIPPPPDLELFMEDLETLGINSQE